MPHRPATHLHSLSHRYNSCSIPRICRTLHPDIPWSPFPYGYNGCHGPEDIRYLTQTVEPVRFRSWKFHSASDLRSHTVPYWADVETDDWHPRSVETGSEESGLWSTFSHTSFPAAPVLLSIVHRHRMDSAASWSLSRSCPSLYTMVLQPQRLHPAALSDSSPNGCRSCCYP